MPYEEMQQYWTENNITPPTRHIVCAANRHKTTGTIICGARHWDNVMRDVARKLAFDHSRNEWDQGFIDQFGCYINREDALQIVKDNGQRFLDDRNGPKSELYSEGLY